MTKKEFLKKLEETRGTLSWRVGNSGYFIRADNPNGLMYGSKGLCPLQAVYYVKTGIVRPYPSAAKALGISSPTMHLIVDASDLPGSPHSYVRRFREQILKALGLTEPSS